MSAEPELELQARMDGLPRAAAFIESFCVRHGVAHGDAMRVLLVFEELFTNTVMHGHGGDGDAPVGLRLDATDQTVTMSYEDTAPPFDPRALLDDVVTQVDADIDDRPIGGLGVLLVLRLATAIDYERTDGRNRLCIVLHRDG